MNNWNTFKNLPKIKDLPIHEQSRQYWVHQAKSYPVSSGNSNGFDINPNNIQWNYIGTQITQNGSIGFNNTGLDNIVDSYVNYIITGELQTIINYWEKNSLADDNTAYIFDVVWGPGSSITNGKVRMSFYNGDNYNNPGYYTLNISTVDTSNDDWMTLNSQSLSETFNFTARFRIYLPITISLNQAWC